jgi:outer membrane receptor for ferrienterochelin and colicins
VNAEGESRIYGSELMLRYKWQDFKLTASYLFLDATEQNATNNCRPPNCCRINYQIIHHKIWA